MKVKARREVSETIEKRLFPLPLPLPALFFPFPPPPTSSTSQLTQKRDDKTHQGLFPLAEFHQVILPVQVASAPATPSRAESPTTTITANESVPPAVERIVCCLELRDIGEGEDEVEV